MQCNYLTWLLEAVCIYFTLLSRPNATLSTAIMQGVVKVPLTAELDICSGKSEHKTSTGVEPQHGERGGERRGEKNKTKIYFQTKSSRRNVLSVYRDGREPMQY